MPNYKIEYTDELPEWIGGRCEYPAFPYFGLGTCIIKIKNKYKDDEGLLKHELEHNNQYRKDWFHVLKYKFNKQYRLDSELKAYKMQMITYGYKQISQCNWIIDALANKYELGIGKDIIVNKVKELLKTI